jgi:imidazolonepropionase-like amidohydrolase/Tol biopolymer transport system component
MKRLLLLSLALFISLPLFGQNNSDDRKWDVTQHRAEYNEISFTTDEGTWMNLDVSPDGRHIVFDMLGNIYIMPITGGEATPLREGLAYEVQPRFSPDGQWISFTSDAGGGDNIWVMRRDGSDAKQITNESFRLMNNAVWAPEGNYLVARKHFTSGRSLGTGELWMFHITGGSGIQLVERPNAQQDLGQPFFSPDGRYIYYSQDVYPGGVFQYNKDPNSQIYAINRYDRETGNTERITGGPGGAISPTLSPDGKTMAFIKRVRTNTVLFLRDLESGIERPVYEGLTKDQQEAWAIFGPYTNFNWTPDGNHIVIWTAGKINKLNVNTGTFEPIPFTVTANHKIADAVHFEFDPAPDTFTAKAIRHAVTSPDGKTLIFNAAGYLWKKDLPNGTPQRLTNTAQLEFEPAFSRDGNKLAWVTWSDTELGAVMTLDLNRRNARPQKITTQKGIFREPSFSPDGRTIVFRRESGNNHQGQAWTQNPGIYTMPAAGGEKTFITRAGSNPIFNAKGDRIFYQAGGFRSVDLTGNDPKLHFRSQYAIGFTPSPDNKWVAFNELFKVYIAPMPITGSDLQLSASTRAIPVTHVARDAGENLHWSQDGKKLHWTLGEEYFTVELETAFEFLSGEKNEELPLGHNDGIRIGLELPGDKPSGTVAFTNARIITMNGDQVIENGTVVVRENRIVAVGNAAQVTVPAGAHVVDVTGKTIMPGLIDVHAHIGNFRGGLSPNQQWEYFANLAYGVTTVHDPSSNTEMIFSQAEMVRAGNMVGPRIFSTGRILYGAENITKTVINNLEDARSAIRRTQAFGATSVKSYNQPRRDQRQQVLQAARELGVNVVPEGGSTFTHNMSMILDGHTGIEHNVPIYPLYNDVLTLWGESKTGYTPTLVVNYGSVSGEYYWYQHTNVWEKERLLTFTPRAVVDSRSRHRTMIPIEEYEIGHIQSASKAKDLLDRGVLVNIGGHGQLQGLAAHWETWMFYQGGMTNHEALRVATLNGAKYIGMGDHIGSIEVGKLADMIVLDGNPLNNIFDTEKVVYTMVNGRLYDASTMNEIGNRPKERLPFWWERLGYDSSFDWHAIIEADNTIQCVCGTRH